MGVEAGTEARVGTRAEVETGAQASKTALKIFCKSFSEYLGTLVAAGALAMGGFVFEGPADWLDNSSYDLGDGVELERATEKAAEERLW